MTADRDRAEDAGAGLPTVVFRPWPPHAGRPPRPDGASIRPCFVDLPGFGYRGHRHGIGWAARPPRFARFAAALQSAGGALGPASVLWSAEAWTDGPGAAGRRPAPLDRRGGFWPMPGGRRAMAPVARARRHPAVLRSTLLVGAAGAAVLALVALFGPIGSQDPARLVGPPAEAGGLVRAPPTPDRYRPAAGPAAPGEPGALLVAHRPPWRSNGALRSNAGSQPAGLAPAPIVIAQLGAAVRPAPRPPATGVAADGKSAATAVRTGALADQKAAPDHPFYVLGQRLQQSGEIALAIQAYRMAAEANPRHAATWYDWGYLLQQQGDEAGALEKYRTALTLDPRHAFAHYNLGYLAQKQANYPDAIQHYRAAIAAEPGFFWSYYNLAYVQQKLGHYREALADYRKSLAIDPKHAESYENIASILRYHPVD